MKSPTFDSINSDEGEIQYEILQSARKSFEITVFPDCKVRVRAPASFSLKLIQKKVYQKSQWINTKIHYFQQSEYKPQAPSKQYIDGEIHLYLDHKYHLQINSAKSNSVSINDSILHIQSKKQDKTSIQNVLDHWYRERAHIDFTRILETIWLAFNHPHLPKPPLKIRRMKACWGNLSSRGTMTLNLHLIHASEIYIEYVVMHELCHLVHFNHSPAYYQLLSRCMPDWKQRKKELNQTMLLGPYYK